VRISYAISEAMTVSWTCTKLPKHSSLP